MNKGAIISSCGKYRFHLWRIWDVTKPCVLFIMHNPSTADEKEDDPTIRRCIAFAESWGYGGIHVGNVSPQRATNPHDLVPDFEGVTNYNLAYVKTLISKTQLHILAFGVPKKFMRVEDILNLPLGHSKWRCLKETSSGWPGHPLYLKSNLTPVPYEHKGKI